MRINVRFILSCRKISLRVEAYRDVLSQNVNRFATELEKRDTKYPSFERE